MLADVRLAAFIVAMVLILVGGLSELRQEIIEARRTNAAVLEWVWIILPVLFLAFVVVLAAEAGLRR